MTRNEAIEQALRDILTLGDVSHETLFNAQKALALPEDAEPVAWMDEYGNAFPLAAYNGGKHWLDDYKIKWKPLYTHPPKADAVCEICAMDVVGSWVNVDDVSRLAKQLDTAMNGKDAAEDPSLTDVIAQAVKILKPKAVDAELVRRIERILRFKDVSHGSGFALLTYIRKHLMGEK